MPSFLGVSTPVTVQLWKLEQRWYRFYLCCFQTLCPPPLPHSKATPQLYIWVFPVTLMTALNSACILTHLHTVTFIIHAFNYTFVVFITSEFQPLILRVQLILVAARSNAYLCGRLLSVSAGSNSAGGWMSVSCECCVLSGRDLCDGPIARPEESYWVWSWSLANEEALTHWGCRAVKKKVS
jgi:hypothetical protein